MVEKYFDEEKKEAERNLADGNRRTEAELALERKKTEAILRDLLSPKEFDDIVVRLQIIKQLKRGIPQRQIAKNLGTGIATVTRGSRELLDKSGGFHTVFREYETNKRKK